MLGDAKLPRTATDDHSALDFEKLDGSFPNHEANPLEPANIVDLQRRVVETGADLGLAFDGDADRCFVVDGSGAAPPCRLARSLVSSRHVSCSARRVRRSSTI